MNIALIMFTLGIIMIVAGYTNQMSPQCDQDIKVRVVPREVYNEILNNKDMVDQVYKDMDQSYEGM